MSLIFVDLETTGLDPAKERILEIAVIVTDDSLVELGRYHRVFGVAREIPFKALEPVVQKMHVANGLWWESCMMPSPGHWGGNSWIFVGVEYDANAEMKGADQELAHFIRTTCAISDLSIDASEKDYAAWRAQLPVLAGSTVSFDRLFLEKYLPTTSSWAHYRNYDVTSINEFAKRAFPAIHDARPRPAAGVAHRAMPDIEGSLAVARHYVAAFAAWMPAGAP